MSDPSGFVGRQAILSSPIIPPLRDGNGTGCSNPPRAAVLFLGALARLTRARILRHVDVLAYPNSKVADQQARLGPPEVSAQLAIVALAQPLCTQPAAGGDAEAISLTLSTAVQGHTPHQKRPAFRCRGASRIRMGPKTA